ncbi:MAG: hypothetical protein EOM92_18600 [Gammaproteobacteria bacterium]|nr:hypothetical protein [Gammaproteobacteria bacterium]
MTQLRRLPWVAEVTTRLLLRDPYGNVYQQVLNSADFSTSIQEQITDGVLVPEPQAIMAAVATALAERD